MTFQMSGPLADERPGGWQILSPSKVNDVSEPTLIQWGRLGLTLQVNIGIAAVWQES